jgi:hypothetical protein
MYNRCLSALDNSPFDRHIISQVELLVKQIPMRELIFAHVDHFQPETAPEREHVLRGESGVADACKDLTRDQPGDQILKGARVVNLMGQPESVLSACVKNRQIDLICVGLKDQNTRFAQVGRRLLCLTDADVLFIPSAKPREIKRILVPVDLSEKSHELIEKTLVQFPTAAIQLYFVNYIPSPLVMSETDRMRLIKEASRNLNLSMQHFIDNLNMPDKSISYQYGMSEQFNAGYAIHEEAEKNSFDLVAIGRLSKLDKELPFLGSVTEKLLSLSENIPVLVINH